MHRPPHNEPQHTFNKVNSETNKRRIRKKIVEVTVENQLGFRKEK
jgi:hypothetical protein